MPKKLFLLAFLLVIPVCLVSYAAPVQDAYKEDKEINDLKAQVKALEKKIQSLEKAKKQKIKNNVKPDAKIVRKAPKVGLVLSGGGAKGMAHVGVLKVLEANNIKIDYITGTSIGALVGALYSAGYTPDEIESALKDVDWKNLFTGDIENTTIPLERKFNKYDYMVNLRYDKSLKFSFPRAFRDTEIIYFQLKKKLKNIENINDFDKLPIPMRVVATNINTGKSVAFKKGDLAKAVTASSAVPTVFGPVEIDGSLYVDGLISKNFPVQEAFDMGADIVIGSNVGNSLKDNADYNIVGVINQLITLQSTSSTEEQEKLATILISPDVQAYSATDSGRNREFVMLGEKAANAKLSELQKLEKNIVKKEKIKNNDVVDIKDIIITGSISAKQLGILKDRLKEYDHSSAALDDIEQTIMSIYGLDFIENIYYKVENNILYVEAKAKPSNLLGLGINYQTGYGSTLNIGTEISNIGKIGSSTFLNLRLGDYLGFEAKNFFYYGTSRKFGLFANFIAKETPFYLYNGNKKIAEYTNETAKIEGGMAILFDNKIFLTYGISSGFSKLNQNMDPGLKTLSDIEYSKNINETFLKISYDDLNSTRHPTAGYKMDFNYTWGGNFKRNNSANYYGPLYILNGYIPLKDDITFKYGLSGGAISGNNIFMDQYIKIGGLKDNIDNKEFSFMGFKPQQKLVKQFLIGKVGIEKELFKNLYIGATYNFGTFEEVGSKAGNFSKKNMWKDPIQGIGVSAVYETLLGPIEFSISKDSKNSGLVSQVSVGYTF